MYIVVFSCGGLTDMYIYVCTSKVEVWYCQADVLIPYRMKIYTELNLMAWHRVVEFMGLNVSNF